MNVLLLLLALAADVSAVGDIWVQAPPGYLVNLDGRPQGAVEAGAKGMVLRDVQPGTHRVDIFKPDRMGATQHEVEVKAGETVNVVLPTLAMIARPRAPEKTGDLQLRVAEPPCSATAGGTSYELPTRDTMIRNLALGKQSVTVQCGPRKLSGQVEIRDGKVVTVEADMARHALTQVAERPRSLKVVVASSDGVDIPASLPGEWRRALSATVDTTITELQVRRTGYTTVRMTFRYARYEDVWALTSRLDYRPEVEKATVISFDRSGLGGRCEIEVTFVGGD